MSKMSELSMVIDEMIACGEGMIKAAKQLKELFSANTQPEEKALPETKAETLPKEETTAKSYSKEEVRGILASKSAKGHGNDVKALLSKYGADKLSTLIPEHYAAVVAEAEVIGNA